MSKSILKLGDCLKVEVPKNFCLITDPPFGLKTDLPIQEVILRLERFVNKADVSIIFSDWRNSHLFAQLGNKIGELVWEYGWVSGGRCRAKSGIFPCHNTLHIFGDKRKVKFIDGTIIKRQPGFSSPRQCSYAKKSGHPYEKPIALIEWLIDRVDCSYIVDPFMGTGSTFIAAQNKGKDYLGVEIEKKWFEIANQGGHK
jgi:DNA modification methylase